MHIIDHETHSNPRVVNDSWVYSQGLQRLSVGLSKLRKQLLQIHTARIFEVHCALAELGLRGAKLVLIFVLIFGFFPKFC